MQIRTWFLACFFRAVPNYLFYRFCRISLVNLSLKLACIIIDHFVIVAVLSLCCCWFALSIVLFNLLNSFLLHCYFSAFPLPHAEASTAASTCVDVNVGVGASLFRGGLLGLFGDSFNINYIFHYSSVALAAAAVDCPLHLPFAPFQCAAPPVAALWVCSHSKRWQLRRLSSFRSCCCSCSCCCCYFWPLLLVTRQSERVASSTYTSTVCCCCCCCCHCHGAPSERDKFHKMQTNRNNNNTKNNNCGTA